MEKTGVRRGGAAWLRSPRLPSLVLRAAMRCGSHPDEIQDVLQEVRLALWALDPAVTVNTTWIIRTAVHKALDHKRTKARAHAREAAYVRLHSPTLNDPDLPWLLHAGAEHLPPDLHRYYRLRYEEGRSEREIAAILGLCRASVRWLDHRCRIVFGESMS